MAANILIIDKHDYRPVFERFIGRYKWGSKDCVHLACALAGSTCGKDLTRLADKYTRRVTQQAAVDAAIEDFGSVGRAYSKTAEKSRYVDVIKPAHMAMREPGDVMWVEGELVTSTGGLIRTENDKDSCIAFVDNSMAMYVWGMLGLVQVGGNFVVREIWRGRSG